MVKFMEVLPFRREPRPIAIDVERCRAEVERALPPDWAKWQATTAELATALDEARAKYTGGATSAAALAEGIASLAVVWTSVTSSFSIEGPGADVLQPTVAPLVDLWIAEHGIAYALDAFVAAYDVVQTLAPIRIEPYTVGRSAAARQPTRWRRLREHVASADDATYAMAREHAERLRTGSGPGAHLITSFVFPWEAAWARADAATPGLDRLALVGTALDAPTCATHPPKRERRSADLRGWQVRHDDRDARR